jgi:GntR family transcriptional repressor for pyruvate dehydrogenase complex
VRALSLARVLEVRQGDGTYVASLEPDELLEPTLSATHLLRGRTVLELFEVRRMLEPEAAAMAALRADEDVIAALREELDRMLAAGDRADDLVEADAAFHDVIGGAPGNGVLRALLRSLSTSTVRARLWHGIADRGALDLAREEHARIYEAIAAGDPDLARAATLLHIATNETWLREHLGPSDDVPLGGD